jgi:hypothetical protein
MRFNSLRVSCEYCQFFSGVVNREKPQSRETKSLGNTQTGGLSRFLRPGKWTRISVPNPA